MKIDPKFVAVLFERKTRKQANRRILTAAIIASFIPVPCHAGCPNEFRKLDYRAQRATEALNAAGPSDRCMKAREVVSIEQRLSRFVEDYQVECVLDQEIIDVQRRRLSKARAALDQACGR